MSVREYEFVSIPSVRKEGREDFGSGESRGVSTEWLARSSYANVFVPNANAMPA